MPETPAFLSERLKSEGEKMLSFFTSLTDEQWASTVYAEGETWTVRSMLAHYVTSEQELLRVLDDVQKGGTGASDDFDVNVYNAAQQEKTAELSPAALLDQFATIRAQTTAFVAGLSEADLEKRGRHPNLGPMNLGEMVKVVYMHNQLHHRDLRKAINNQ